MKYELLNDAIKRTKNVKSETIIDAIAEYVGADKKDVENVIFPVLELWKESERADKPVVCIWRNLATSQFESWIVKHVAGRIGGIPAWFTYTQDVFMKDNPEKIIFEKVRMYMEKGKNVRKPIHLCEKLEAIEGIPFDQIQVIDGKSLVDFHLEMREAAGFPMGNIIDLGSIFKKLLHLSPEKEKYINGYSRAKKEWYYPIWMYLSAKLVVLEDYEICKGGMKELVESSYDESVAKGLTSNFVRLKAIKAVDWYMTRHEPEGVPPEIKKIAEEIINANGSLV